MTPPVSGFEPQGVQIDGALCAFDADADGTGRGDAVGSER
jgi:acyl transferase domain-containing protein